MYSYIFAHSETHQPPKSLKDLKKNPWNYNLILLFNGIPVGKGELDVKNYVKKWVHTDCVRLYDGFRRKGHGIHLYKALITAARKIGATRLYSSQNLNKFSRRMWSKKINRDLHLNVHEVIRCKNGCRHCEKKPVYYIEL